MCLFFTNINNGLKIIHCFFASWRFGWMERKISNVTFRTTIMT